jgi:DNA-binding CsgD family transcriptional regulator
VSISRQLVNPQEVVREPPLISPLSRQKTEILRLFSMDNNSAEIARKLGFTLQALRTTAGKLFLNNVLRSERRTHLLLVVV